MQPFTRLTGAAAPLPLPNIDTDVIMPKQFLKGVDRKGLDRGAFFDLRFDKSGAGSPASFSTGRAGPRRNFSSPARISAAVPAASMPSGACRSSASGR